VTQIRTACVAAFITTAKFNVVDPQAWLSDVFTHMADTSINKLEQLLLWNCTSPMADVHAA